MTSVAADPFGDLGKHLRERIFVAQHLILHAQRMHFAHPLRERRSDSGFHQRLKERAVEREIGLRNLGNGCEHALVLRLMAAKRADVVQAFAARNA